MIFGTKPSSWTQKETASNLGRFTTVFDHLALTDQISREQHSTSTGPLRTKTYSYDAAGNRLGMTDTPSGGTPSSYTYGYDVHGSVSLLLNATGSATAAYGYTAYGELDQTLSKGDTNDDDPLNPYRYTGKRYDSGSGTLDMGARRFGPGPNRFLQRDQYNGAVANLGLSTDPLSQNRYSLAGGNPISFIEVDGHIVTEDGTGTATRVATTSDGTRYQTNVPARSPVLRGNPDGYSRKFDRKLPAGTQRQQLQEIRLQRASHISAIRAQELERRRLEAEMRQTEESRAPNTYTKPAGHAISAGGCLGVVLAGCASLNLSEGGRVSVGVSVGYGLGANSFFAGQQGDAKGDIRPGAEICAVVCGSIQDSGASGGPLEKLRQAQFGLGTAAGVGVFETEAGRYFQGPCLGYEC